MNIAIIDMDNLKNPFWAAGQATATREVGKRLAKKHDVTVYCSKYPKYKDYMEDGVKYVHVGINSMNSKIINLAFIITVPFIVRKIKADIIIENFNAPTSVSFAPLFTKIPVIALPSMFNAVEFYKKYHIPFHWIERIGMKFYKYMLPYSEVDSAKAVSLNPKIKLKIVQQGVEARYLKIKQKNPKHILFLGRFDITQKGIDLLVEAYAKVKNDIKYPLILAGHGPDEHKIRKLIDKYELHDKVKIVGPAYGEKKFKLMSEALYVAFPSMHDEMCLWALEALAGGLPLICFDLPESKWMNDDISIKAKPFTADEYAKILLQATNMELMSKMRKASRDLARKYPWEKVASEFESFINEVLEIEGK